jgi:hypothetical protein
MTHYNIPLCLARQRQNKQITAGNNYNNSKITKQNRQEQIPGTAEIIHRAEMGQPNNRNRVQQCEINKKIVL